MIVDKHSNISLLHQVYGDSKRIKQVLINFISNSIKHTPKQGKITILIKIDEELDQSDYAESYLK